MAVPKSKITRSRRGMRRSHDSLSPDAYVESKDTGELHRPHHIDLKTGMYKGRQVLNIKSKTWLWNIYQSIKVKECLAKKKTKRK